MRTVERFIFLPINMNIIMRIEQLFFNRFKALWWESFIDIEMIWLRNKKLFPENMPCKINFTLGHGIRVFQTIYPFR